MVDAGRPVRAPLVNGQSARGLRAAISWTPTSRDLSQQEIGNRVAHWPHSCEGDGPDPPLRTRSHSIGLFVTIQYSVLVVEDDGDLCDVLSELLSQAGYDVRCAHDGEEAWADVQRDPPDLVLSDIRMPKLDGIDLASRLISGGYRTPIILMSASHTDRAGVSAAFIRKPFAFDHLLAVIARALDTPTAQRGRATA